MKLIRLALVLSAVVLCARAADDSEDKDKQQKAPTEIPDFSNLDEYIYQPKSTLNFGFRYVTGIKAKFWGSGQIGAPEALPDPTAPDISRTYHDGTVQPDTRTGAVDNGNGTTTSVPIAPDGKTNSWSYDDSSQLTSSGFMQFHIYSAQITDNTVHDESGKDNLGLEVSEARDLRDFGKHWSLKLFAGFSTNDIQAAAMSPVQANITTVTATYDLFGQTPPAAPYSQSGSSSTAQSGSNSTGGSNTDINGATVNQTVSTTTLLGSAPLNTTTSSEVDSSTVVDHWKVHGAYATLRGGPMLVYKFNDHLHLDFGAGVALIYAGSTYQVSEVLMAPTGGEIIDTLTDTTSRLLPAYYVEATLQYDLTDRTGFYFGASLQNAGGYTQTAVSNLGSAYGDASGTGTGEYKTRVDFDNQEGIRSGLTFRF